MESDPSFQGQFPHLSALFPENPSSSKPEEIPTMFPLQTSVLIPPPHNNPLLNHLKNNTFHHFHHDHIFNVPNNHNPHAPPLVMEGPPPSTTPFYALSSTPISRGFLNLHNPVVTFAPNNINKIDALLHDKINIWDFSQKSAAAQSSTTAAASSFLQTQKGPSQELPCITHLSKDTDLRGALQHMNKRVKVQKDSNTANIIKGMWTPDEDRELVELVKQHGLKKWSQIAKSMEGRIGKQCRERWHNHLRPNIRKESWTIEEDMLLIKFHQEVGNKWVEIARRMPGRSENTIKNHWNATKRRQSFKKQKNRPDTEGSLLYVYIEKLTAAEEAAKELKKNMSKMKMKMKISSGCDDLVHFLSSKGAVVNGNGEGTSTGSVVDDANTDYGAMVDEMKREMDLMQNTQYI